MMNSHYPRNGWHLLHSCCEGVHLADCAVVEPVLTLLELEDNIDPVTGIFGPLPQHLGGPHPEGPGVSLRQARD